MTTIQVRIDEKTKAKAKKVFRKMGLDISSGVKLYLARVVQDETVPFVVRTVNGYTPEQEREIIRETEYAEKHGKRYSDIDELMRDVFGKK
ncbi:MAG TPA: type II toxin-antitoxin system RelB/DinJ family antitoxin [Candidatus Paceibacterota bacterium]|nr:type II toxin-antitoxin system RelB/DinJ family antitoxin [Candidatus Paceibacterota bacterium]